MTTTRATSTRLATSSASSTVSNGILLLDKPLGLSSNAALQRVRRAYRSPKAGHVGSLDPLATGMLPICLGEATKVAGEIVSGRKRYAFTIGLGARTATGDTEGEVVERLDVPDLDDSAVDRVLAAMTGDVAQIPPMYSALKRDGQPLYKLARAGVEVERAPRQIRLHELVRVGLDRDSLRLEVECSKGTYVRVLAEDIAWALGTCGHVTRLHRSWVEPFEAVEMWTLDQVLDAAQADQPIPLMPPEHGLPDWERLAISAADVDRLRHGQPITGRAPGEGAVGRLCCLDEAGVLVALGERDAAGLVHPKRVFSL